MTASNQTQLHLNNCGCCEGLAVETPVEINNRPGLSAIAYRAGTQTRFKASLIVGLSESGLAELRKLRTRDNDDFTIALLDAWAVVCDVLTFYQERIANESYLLTATERASIINLARLIGYELRPGVAAGTYLAFTLETGEGAPAAVTIGKGVKVQSIPGPEEKPQTFETIEKIDAQGEWNAMKPRLTELHYPAFGDTHAFLQGVTTNLKPGDPLLIVGAEPVSGPTNDNWEIRHVSSVEPDAENDRTLVRWDEPLSSRIPHVDPPQEGPTVYALRLRASIFGYNALAGSVDSKQKEADALFDAGTRVINLDSVYSQITLNSWIALVTPDSTVSSTGTKSGPLAELYRVEAVGEEAKADFNISAKTTRLEISDKNIEQFSPRNATALAQSERLLLAETPITDPVCNDAIVLEQLIAPLAEGRNIIVTGRLLRARIKKQLSLVSIDDPKVSLGLKPGDELIVLAPWTEAAGTKKRWRLLDRSGFAGYVDASTDEVTPIPASERDAMVSEVATIKSTGNEDDAHSRLVLSASLGNVFDRTTVSINANVALGTHGETVANEVLGSGDPGQTYQRFTLSESPLAYTSADNPTGGEPSLEVRVNDLKWTQVPTLFDRGPRERVYTTHTDDDQKTTVQFGDGVIGARLPKGSENVTATYRKGIGREGLVKADQLSLLMTRPLGVQSVLNPLPATGAQDQQSLADARVNSPLTVLTLDRIVSLSDYEDFASSFSGIGKALATWTWNVHARGVFVTVAGIDGATVDQKLHETMVSAMLKCADAHVPITVKSYRAVTFKLVADVKLDSDYIEEKVLAAIETALRSSFSFASRVFGQPVTLSEVVAVIQNVAGVVAVDVNKLYRSDEPEGWNALLVAEAPRAGIDAGVPAAELLTLDLAPLELGVMP